MLTHLNINFENMYYVYNVDDIMIKKAFEDVELVGGKVKYYNMSNSFDIEVSSFLYDGKKVGLMYLWGLDINGLLIYGREWEEFILILDFIMSIVDISLDKRLVIYVHNLSYEFQFIRKKFTWEKVHARTVRKPMSALTTSGIEFRCSYILSGYSLAVVAKNLIDYKIEKLVETMDYSLLRTPDTLLNEEIPYLKNDILIVEYYIKEEKKWKYYKNTFNTNWICKAFS